MHQVARMVDLHSRKPFERRGRDVIVVAHADDGRIGIEARENRIPNEARVAHRAVSGERCSRTTVHNTTAPSTSKSPRQAKNGAYPTVATNPPISSENRSKP